MIAGLTDAADGFIARKFHMRSRLGSMLDPLADKFLMVASFLFLASENFQTRYKGHYLILTQYKIKKKLIL